MLNTSPYNRLIILGLLFGSSQIAIAEEAINESEWQFASEVYIWGSEISGTSPNGADFEIPFHTIIDNLDMTLMGRIGARKDKLTLFSDFIYLNIESEEEKVFNVSMAPDPSTTINGELTVGLETWIIQPTAAYTVFEENRHSIDLLAGARYIWSEVDLNLKVANKNIGTTQSAHNWDGIIGVRGKIALTDKWNAIAYADAGTGDSDSTLQGLAVLSYQFDNFEGRFGYRYLNWKFDSDQGLGTLMEDLTVKGPYAGALFKF